MTEIRAPYPVRIDAAAEPSSSRGLWLVKWVLLIPHLVVLGFLWVAFAVVSVMAFVAILITGRYPRALFDFNVGVLRWTWRVNYYGYAALGTDAYPPFTLADVPDYPARLEIPYPERLSRGLVLVKWWLLALPHYVVLALLVGGGLWLGAGHSDAVWPWRAGWGAGGLVALLVLIAAVVLLFSGRYPRGLYDAIVGMDRWALRVAAYAGLMTDAYPPFRLDLGGPDPGSPSGLPAGPTPPPTPGAATGGAAGSRWTAGRVVSVVLGAVLLFGAAGAGAAGGTLLWAGLTQRADGYVSSPASLADTARYAVVTDRVRLEGSGLPWVVENVIGDARLRVDPAAGRTALFVGLAPTASVRRYLDGVGHGQAVGLGPRWDGLWPGRWTMIDRPGHAPAIPPEQAGIWTAWTAGEGVRSLLWRPSAGDWTVVIMRADGMPGVSARVQIGATLPGLGWMSAALLVISGVLLVAGGLMIGVAAHRAGRTAQRGTGARAPAMTGT